jgi:hypothetical protein
MCNLYSLTKGQAAIRDWFRANNDSTGNLPLFPGIFPDQWHRSFATERMARASLSWRAGGCPVHRSSAVHRSPIFAMLAARTGAAGSASKTAASCQQPRSASTTKPRKTPKWFALGQDRPLFAFAGLWTPWRGMRGPKSAPVDGQHELFGFLTTEANAVVAPIHPKAMPVILTTPEEVDLCSFGACGSTRSILGLIATDMEAATLLTAGRMLGARIASLCLGTVDGITQAKLDADTVARREAEMFETALDALVASRV